MVWPLSLHIVQLAFILAFLLSAVLLLIEHVIPPEPGAAGFLTDAGVVGVSVVCGISFISIVVLNWTPIPELLIKAYMN